MTPPLTINLLRCLYVVFVTSVGAMAGAYWAKETPLQSNSLSITYMGAAIGLTTGLVVVLIDKLLKGLSLRVFSSATFGLILGNAFAWLLQESKVLYYLEQTNPAFAWVISMTAYCIFGYLGMMLAMRSNRDEFSLVIPYVRFTRQSIQDTPVVLDMSAILDGRIADLCNSGFLSKYLIVPEFVSDAINVVADAKGDPVRRERYRRGREYLESLENNSALSLRTEETPPDELPYETRLLRFAERHQAALLTADSNIAKAARQAELPVLNLQNLDFAMRPLLQYGDEVRLVLVKHGREDGQAQGYSPNGSLVVVNHAAEFLGQTVECVIISMTVTNAGRLHFAELKKNYQASLAAANTFTMGAPRNQGRN